LRPENTGFKEVLAADKAITEIMTSLKIPFIRIAVEDLQERAELVENEIFKRWTDLKRNHTEPIPFEENQKTV